MPQDVRIADDLKSAAVLAGLAGVLGAATVPFLLPAITKLAPPDQRELPLPLPLFCVAVAVQFLVVYGALALAGLRLARARDREPAPLLTAVWTHRRPAHVIAPAGRAFGTGLACGLVLVGAILLIKQTLPQTLPDTLHPPSFAGALLASATASVGEEILCRLLALSALLRLLPATRTGTAIAVAASAILFGVLHAPAAVFLFGGLERVPYLSWVWVIALNGLVGVACGVWYLRAGIGAAILVHFGTDLVWHVLARLI